MEPQAKVMGVYPVEASEPVYLVEIEIHDCTGKINLSDISQEMPGQLRSNWQVPYEDKILNHDGKSIKADSFLGMDKPDDWIGFVRLTFFFHYLDAALEVAFGDAFDETGDVDFHGASLHALGLGALDTTGGFLHGQFIGEAEGNLVEIPATNLGVLSRHRLSVKIQFCHLLTPGIIM